MNNELFRLIWVLEDEPVGGLLASGFGYSVKMVGAPDGEWSIEGAESLIGYFLSKYFLNYEREREECSGTMGVRCLILRT